MVLPCLRVLISDIIRDREYDLLTRGLLPQCDSQINQYLKVFILIILFHGRFFLFTGLTVSVGVVVGVLVCAGWQVCAGVLVCP